ncbi:hypothetical protein [Bacillus massilinigeriensis]|uniref:hypothetical protein n=1 Tax=Bacillus massilionigeriensis TaxID=1805475 RepID=UPI00096B2AEE|nr:hypothetical protein [Bacillus massilionigeriensis]
MNRKIPLIGIILIFVLSLVLPQGKASADLNVTDLVFKQTYKGIYDYSNKPTYKITMPSDGQLNLEFTRSETADWYLELVDIKTGYVIDDFHTERLPGKDIRKIGLKKGSYYLQFTSGSNSKEQYQFVATYKTGYYEKEVNNTTKTATSISLNKTYKGSRQHYSDKDYYKFTLKKNGNIALNITKMPSKYWYVTIINSKGQVYLDRYTDSNIYVTGTQKFYLGLPKGTYYVVVNSGSTDNEYSLRVSYVASEYYEKEFNNSRTKANSIRTGKYYQGVLQSYSDVDFFKFNVSKKKKVYFYAARNTNTYWKVNILNSRGTRISYFYTRNGSSGSGYERYIKTLNKGTYYMVVEYGSRDIPYKFKVNY